MAIKQHKACYCFKISGQSFCSPKKRRASKRIRAAMRKGLKTSKIRKLAAHHCMGYGF